MDNTDHNNRLPIFRPDKSAHSPDCSGRCLVQYGTSLQNSVYCCLTSKRTFPLRQGHSLRSSIDNTSTTRANTKLTEKNVMDNLSTQQSFNFHRYHKKNIDKNDNNSRELFSNRIVVAKSRQ